MNGIVSHIFSLPFLLIEGFFLAPGLTAAALIASISRKTVNWCRLEFVLLPLGTVSWMVLEMPGVSRHPGKSWANLLVELGFLGLLPVVYAVFRCKAYRGAMPFWAYCSAGACAFAIAFACHRFIPTIPLLTD
jgi:hypothetical protein